MKKELLLVICALWASFANAGSITTRVHDVMAPETANEAYLILGTNGAVYEVSENNSELVKKAYAAKKSGHAVEFKTKGLFLKLNDTSAERDILKDIVLKSPEDDGQVENEVPSVPTALDNYSPSVLADMNEAKKVFRSMRRDHRRKSQCYNRAHVWTYELWKNVRIDGEKMRSQKIWIFFTRKYIRAYRYKWWFHVAPLTSVAGASEDVVLDRKFSSRPQLLTEWKNFFMHNNAFCPEIKFYSEYNNNQQYQDCYLLKSNMFYHQPLDIERLENDGVESTYWNMPNLIRAYKDGIRWRSRPSASEIHI